MGSLFLPGPAGGKIDMPDEVVASLAEGVYPALEADRVFYLSWAGRDQAGVPRRMTAVISRAMPPAFVYDSTQLAEADRNLVDEIQESLASQDAGFDISGVTF